MDIKEIFARRLTKLRENSNVSQQTLADDLGITRQSLSLYEKADRTINIDLLYRISKHFNVSTDYLLGLTDNATTDVNLKLICEYTGLSEDAIRELNNNLNPPYKTEVKYLTKFHKILSWLINEQYIQGIIYHLVLIKDYSQEYLTFEEEISSNGLYLVNDKEAEQAELNNIMELQKLEKNIDFERYMLVKLSEEMANHFDQREWVKKNGEHNPPKE